MNIFGKRLNSLGQGLLGLITVYGIFALAGITAYNFILFPMILCLIFLGFEDEPPKSNDNEDKEESNK